MEQWLRRCLPLPWQVPPEGVKGVQRELTRVGPATAGSLLATAVWRSLQILSGFTAEEVEYDSYQHRRNDCRGNDGEVGGRGPSFRHRCE